MNLKEIDRIKVRHVLRLFLWGDIGVFLTKIKIRPIISREANTMTAIGQKAMVVSITHFTKKVTAIAATNDVLKVGLKDLISISFNKREVYEINSVLNISICRREVTETL